MKVLRASGVACLALILSAHVGSPDVFYSGRAGPYDIRVIIRPPEVVPGVAPNANLPTQLGGTGGLIAIDKEGHTALPFNTSGMYRGHADSSGKMVIDIYK